jgi:hypothetical protein
MALDFACRTERKKADDDLLYEFCRNLDIISKLNESKVQ